MDKNTIKLFWEIFKKEKIEKEYIFYKLNEQWRAAIITENGSDYTASLATEYVIETADFLLSNGVKEIYIAHNHPKSTPHPSFPDQFQLKYLDSIFNFYGIKIIDYLILSPYGYVSFNDNNMMNLSEYDINNEYKTDISEPISFNSYEDIIINKNKIISLLEKSNEVLLTDDSTLSSISFSGKQLSDLLDKYEGNNVYIIKNGYFNDEMIRVQDIDTTLSPVEIYSYSSGDFTPLKFEGII